MSRSVYEQALAQYRDAIISGRAVDVQRLAAEVAQAAQHVATEEGAAKRKQLHETWTTWTPQAAPHVTGRWTARVFDPEGMPEPQRIEAECKHCGARWQGTCTSGRVREHLQRFAMVHLHRDPFTGAAK